MRDRAPLPLGLSLARLLKRVFLRYRMKSQSARSNPEPAIPPKPPKPANSDWDWIWTGNFWVSPWFPRSEDHMSASVEAIQIKGSTFKINLFTKNRDEPGEG